MNTPNPCCKCKNFTPSGGNGEYLSLSDEFSKVFKMDLREFVRPVLGFDVILFDNRLNVSVGDSTISCIEKDYGRAGINVIERILKYEEKGGFL